VSISDTIADLQEAKGHVDALQRLIARLPSQVAATVTQDVWDRLMSRYSGPASAPEPRLHCGPTERVRREAVLLLLADHPDGLRTSEIVARLNWKANAISRLSRSEWFRKSYGGSHSHAPWVLTDAGKAELRRRKKGEQTPPPDAGSAPGGQNA